MSIAVSSNGKLFSLSATLTRNVAIDRQKP
jgi:hypothetical protein